MLFYYRKIYRSSNRKSKWPLILIAVAVFFFAIILCIQKAGRVVSGNAKNYQQLKKVNVLGQYLEYFPQSGKNFCYWCSRGSVSGTYEMTERDFTEWAEWKNWKLQGTAETFKTFQVPPSLTPDTYVQFKDGLYYQKQILKKSGPHKGQIVYGFHIYFDRAEQKVYFSCMIE